MRNRQWITVDWQLIRFRMFLLWLRITLRKPCEECGGTGCVERLDSGIMMRFGMRPWNGCKKCSTDREQVGTGIETGK